MCLTKLLHSVDVRGSAVVDSHVQAECDSLPIVKMFLSGMVANASPLSCCLLAYEMVINKKLDVYHIYIPSKIAWVGLGSDFVEDF